MKIIITGGSGLLALNWACIMRSNAEVCLFVHEHNVSLDGVKTKKVDLLNLEEINNSISGFNADLVVHTAGLTNVEMCEKAPELAARVNTEIACNIAKSTHQLGIKLVHISTDHLFSGVQSFVSENDTPYPLNEYARTKLNAENCVAEINPDALIVRTNFYGWGHKFRQSFSDWVIQSLNDGVKIKLFDNVFYTPVLIDELVDVVNKLVSQSVTGIVNVVGDERVSKYQFGLTLAETFQLDKKLIQKVNLQVKKRVIKRPLDMSLSNNKVKKILDCEFNSLEKSLRELKTQQKMGRYDELYSVVSKLQVQKSKENKLIPYGKHYLDEDDIQAVVDVLRNGALTQGPKIAEFEKVIAEYTGAKYAVAVSSGTAALHLACIAAEIGNGDKVVTTPNTFVASANCILYQGGIPEFVDIDEKTLNIDIQLLEDRCKITPDIKAIIPVHFAGLPCEMKSIKTIADGIDAVIIEDASHALGATYTDGSRVGNCLYSDMTVFSFHPVKGIASGEGGMVTTNNEEIYQKLLRFRSHGICKGNFDFPGISHLDNQLIKPECGVENGELKMWYYEMQELGFNYRITDIQCALAISQMKKIEKFIEKRRSLVMNYDTAFESNEHIQCTQLSKRQQSSHHIYVIQIDFSVIDYTRHELMKSLVAKNIGSQVHYIPVPMQPYYEKLGCKISDFPITESYYHKALSIPLYYQLSEDEQNNVISALIELIK